MNDLTKIATSNTGAVIAIAVIGAAALYYSSKKAADVGQAVNPVNDDNIFNQGVLSVGRKITGNPHWTLGGWIYDITH
ncbi:hypothetical protein J7384_10245 [Endozoicomonas sp. G2_1]|uniref:hypothetical protein n=1 Tax=Endozoicomonas sp. G2_1 TaxID=2821091 RepID=UPI001ADCDB82|nr:hypothetical protein [Endozoicomonas sp. G2_1]MBO9490740.1 hypothetical protein [Endozoicomonas sp. G2_1]